MSFEKEEMKSGLVCVEQNSTLTFPSLLREYCSNSRMNKSQR